MSNCSIKLIVIGAILISIAVFMASSIPLEANKDTFTYRHKQRHLELRTREREDMYMQMQADRRMRQNFYIGASGLICLFAGLMAPAKKNITPAAVL